MVFLENAEVYDSKGLYTAPGLIDIHNHGGGDWLFAENPAYCAEYFLKHGVTTVLPMFYHNLDMYAELICDEVGIHVPPI